MPDGVSLSSTDQSSDEKASPSAATRLQPPSDVQSQTKQTEQRAQPEVEQQRKKAQDESKKTLDKEAIAAIEQTQKAVDAIAAGKTDLALSAVEEATRSIDALVAHNKANALIPAESEIQIIDTAPHDTQAILEIAQDVSRALDDKNYPTARALLYTLMSEIRVRTFNLPLATYPDALREAARLLGQKDLGKAKNVLLTALNTLVVVDRVTPIPLVLARDAINQAQAKSKQDKKAAQGLLERARQEVERARELGYAGKDKEYASLIGEISNLEKELKGDEDVGVVFSKVKDKLSAFLKRQSTQRHG